jgi:hypothetical protein
LSYFPDNRPHEISIESKCISGGFGFVEANERDAEFGLNKYLNLFTTGFALTELFSGKTFEFISKYEKQDFR